MRSMRATGLSVAVMGLFVSISAHAQFIDPALPGITDFDGWDNLSITNPQILNASPPFPTFTTGGAPWPEPIESVLTQGTPTAADDDPTGDAYFDKTSGFGYPAGVSIYSTPFGSGTFQVSDDTPVANLETIIFQVEIGEGSSGFLAGDATLTINETTLVPLFAAGFDAGAPQPNPFGGGTISVPIFSYQWDLTGLGPVTSFDIDFGTAGTSTTIFALQLDQGSEFVEVVPEASSMILAGIGSLTALGIAVRRRRRS